MNENKNSSPISAGWIRTSEKEWWIENKGIESLDLSCLEDDHIQIKKYMRQHGFKHRDFV